MTVQQPFVLLSFLTTLLGVGLVTLGSLLRFMPNLTYPRLRSKLYHLSPTAKEIRDAREELFSGRVLNELNYKQHRTELEAAREALRGSLSTREEEWNKISFTTGSIRIEERSGSRKSFSRNHPKDAMRQMLNDAISDQFQRLSIRLLVVGGILTIIGAIPLGLLGVV